MKLKKLLCFPAISILMLGCAVPAFAAEDSVATVSINGEAASYTSFEEAWNKAVSGSKNDEITFTLNENWTASGGSLGSGAGFRSGQIKYSGSGNLTLDLNGYTIDRNVYSPKEYGGVIYVESELTIIDSRSNEYTASKLFRGGAITGGSNSGRGGGIDVADNATLNFNGGTILNCVSTDEGGGISIKGSGAVLNVNGGSFYGNRTYDSSSECRGGAIYAVNTTVNITNAVFDGNYTEDSGGAIYAHDGNLTVKNSVFNGNSARESGGVAYISGDIKSSFEDCTFTGNTAKDDGGAIYFDSDDGSYLYNCNMYYNYCGSEGGAVHVDNDRVFIIGGNYQYNTAKDQGGGIYVDSMYDVNIAGKLVVSNNTANGKERDLCLQDGNFSTAYLYCGGLYEGSSVYICSTDGDSRLAIRGIDKYQYNNYIKFDSGFTQEKVKEQSVSSDNINAEGSALGEGNVLYIVVLAVIAAGCIVAVLVVKKRKEAKENG